MVLITKLAVMRSSSNSILVLVLSLLFLSDDVFSSNINARDKRFIDPNAKTDDNFEFIKHQVMLVIIRTERPYCGGTIIGERFILTAAHCVIDKRTNDFRDQPVKIVAGTNTLFKNERSNRIYRYVEEIVVPVRYKQPETGYDIAILKLSEGFGVNSGLSQLNLPDPEEHFNDVIAVVSGFGTYKIEHLPDNPTPIYQKPRSLRYENVHVLSERKCRELWGLLFGPDQICGRLTGSFTRQGICRGDSGSGLAYDGKIIGVVSYGYRCNEGPGGLPSMYTRVSHFSKLLSSIVIDGVRNPKYVRARRYRINESFA